MLKLQVIFLLVFISNNVFSQSTLQRLQGEWLIEKVIDLQDNTETRGKYTDENGYLKFNFKKRELFITTSPIDKGLSRDFILTKDDEIKLQIPFPIPENEPEATYKIVLLNESHLKLTTISLENKNIEYTFKRPIKNAEIPNTIEIEPIIIKKIIYKNARANSIFFYHFNKNTHDYQHPIYRKGITLGTNLTLAVNYPEDFKLGELSKELTISIIINTKGEVSKITKISSANSLIDDSVIKFLKNSKWIPLEVDSNKVSCELMFHFYFLAEEGSLF